jgi:hypothetical protein
MASYTTSTESIKVVAQNIDFIRIGLHFQQNGTTAPTLANVLAHTSDIKLTVGGEVQDLVRLQDLFVYDLGVLLVKPEYALPAGDSQYGRLTNIVLPVKLTTDKEVYLELTYVGQATMKNEKLTIGVEYGDVPFPPRPIAFQYISGNTSPSFVEFDMSKAGRKLIGLLIYNTTIPTTSAYDATVGELKVLVKRSEVMHKHFNEMALLNEVDDASMYAIVKNYRYIDLSNDPIPADDLKVAVKSLVSATDAFRIVGVYA